MFEETFNPTERERKEADEHFQKEADERNKARKLTDRLFGRERVSPVDVAEEKAYKEDSEHSLAQEAELARREAKKSDPKLVDIESFREGPVDNDIEDPLEVSLAAAEIKPYTLADLQVEYAASMARREEVYKEMLKKYEGAKSAGSPDIKELESSILLERARIDREKTSLDAWLMDIQNNFHAWFPRGSQRPLWQNEADNFRRNPLPNLKNEEYPGRTARGLRRCLRKMDDIDQCLKRIPEYPTLERAMTGGDNEKAAAAKATLLRMVWIEMRKLGYTNRHLWE